MNKLAIRLSRLRSDSVDIVGVHRIWKSYGWPSYVFHEYVYVHMRMLRLAVDLRSYG